MLLRLGQYAMVEWENKASEIVNAGGHFKVVRRFCVLTCAFQLTSLAKPAIPSAAW